MTRNRRLSSSWVRNLILLKRWLRRVGDIGPLPPANQLEHWDDDVVGAAMKAADEPVAGVTLGRAGQLLAAMGTLVRHGGYYSLEFF